MKIEIFQKNGYPVLVLDGVKTNWQSTMFVGKGTQRFVFEREDPKSLSEVLQPKIDPDEENLLKAVKEKPGQARGIYAEMTKLPPDRISKLLAKLRLDCKVAMAGDKATAVYYPVG